MRDFLKKAFAVTLGTCGLGSLMVHAALTNGCRAGASSDAQAPPNASPGPAANAIADAPASPANTPATPSSAAEPSPPPSATASATENPSPERPKRRPYMGATKAPPLDFFREGLATDAGAKEPAQVEPPASNEQAR